MNQAALLTIANELSHEQVRVLMALLAELATEDVCLASTNLRPLFQDAKLNKVLYGSTHVGFL
uniref:hypothetical protein n=1 Tax=Aeromonas hydrophila TaxID=644 RepID=UPI001CC37CE6